MEQAHYPPPGWYPDPSGSPGWRYWDGARWQHAATPSEMDAPSGMDGRKSVLVQSDPDECATYPTTGGTCVHVERGAASLTPRELAAAQLRIQADGLRLILASLSGDDGSTNRILREAGDCSYCRSYLITFLAGMAATIGEGMAQLMGRDRDAAVSQFEKQLADVLDQLDIQ